MTILAKRWMVKRKRLANFNLERVKKTLCRQLSRKFPGVPAIGVVEISWKEHFKRYCIHVHLVTPKIGKQKLRGLRNLYPSFRQKIRDPQIYNHPLYRGTKQLRVRGLVKEPIYDFFKLLGYFSKGSTATKPKFVGDNGKLRDGRFRRPKKIIHAEILEFYARHKQLEFVLLKGVRISTLGLMRILQSLKGRA